MEQGNQKRIAAGLEPHPIHPQAYEIADEYSIDWDDNRTLN